MMFQLHTSKRKEKSLFVSTLYVQFTSIWVVEKIESASTHIQEISELQRRDPRPFGPPIGFNDSPVLKDYLYLIIYSWTCAFKPFGSGGWISSDINKKYLQ